MASASADAIHAIWWLWEAHFVVKNGEIFGARFRKTEKS